MNILSRAFVVLSLRVFVLLCELPQQHHVMAQDNPQVVRRYYEDKPSKAKDSQEKTIADTELVRHMVEKKTQEHFFGTKRVKSGKKCKCVCPYDINRPASAQCATVTPPAPPTPSGSNSSGIDIRIPPLQANGIFPSLAVTADSGPARSECGTGALMPWANKLYMVSYLSVPNAGSGTGLYAIDENFTV